MFGRDKNKIANEKVLYESRPSFLISCSSILIAMIVLGVLFYAYTAGIRMVGNMTVFLVNSVETPITSYYALAILILMIFVFLYIVWKILSWSTVKYKITNYRVIVKKGFITEDKTYMPFNTIQDISVSKGILGRLISVGTLTLYSNYDGKNVELKDIFAPSKVEDLIFENMRISALQPRDLYDTSNNNYGNSSGPLSVAGGVFSRLKEKENEIGARDIGNIYHQNHAEIVPEHNYAMSDTPVNDISDLDDLELVDVKERERNLIKLRKQANKNRNNYNNSRSYNSQYQGNMDNFQSPYNKIYDSDLDDYEYINGPSHYSKQNQQKYYNPNHNSYNLNYPLNQVNSHNQGYQNNQRDYQDNYFNQGNYNQNYNQNHNPNQEYANMYIQDVSPEGFETYEPVHNESIRYSYRRNPDKYFADNYERFHENNFKSSNHDEYEISDVEFDRTVMEANRNLNNKNILFKGQKFNYYDEFTNGLVNDFNYNYDNKNYNDSRNYRNSNHFYDVNYNNRNHSNRRNDFRKNYNNYNKNKNCNKNYEYNKKNQRYNNNSRCDSNSNSNNYDYSSDYSKDKTSKDVIKKHSRKFCK